MNAALLAAAFVSLTGLDGSSHPVEFSKHRATVVLFTSTVCPVAADYSLRIETLWRTLGQRKGVRFLVVFPNQNESAESVARHAREMSFPFPVYLDSGNLLADLLAARVTPTAVVIDAGGAIRYAGAIDDAVNPARVKRPLLKDAIEATLAGRRPKIAAWEPYG